MIALATRDCLEADSMAASTKRSLTNFRISSATFLDLKMSLAGAAPVAVAERARNVARTLRYDT